MDCIILVFVTLASYKKVLASATDASVHIPFRADWVLWKYEYGKNYNLNEENTRLRMWLSNYKEASAHNHRFHRGKEFYVKGMNKFTDHAPEDLKRMLRHNYPLQGYYTELTPVKLQLAEVPDNLKWQVPDLSDNEDHIIYPIGWAVSAIATIQAHIHRLTGQTTKLSVNEIIDCMERFPEQKISSVEAFSYVLQNGVTLDASYSGTYNQGRRSCKRSPKHPKTYIKGYHLLEPEDEDNLKLAVALIGPISVNIEVTENFFFYQSGVFYDPSCNVPEHLTNHAVLLVGYGTDPFGGDFWIIQNNWGSHWGENGFARMSRNSVNNCGIAAVAVFSVL